MVRSPHIRYPTLQLGLALAVSATVGLFALEAGVDPLTTVFWRCAFGATFLMLWSLAFGYLRRNHLARRNLVLSGIAGGFLALCWVSLFYGFRMTSIATATLVFQSYPFILVLGGLLVWRERVTPDQLLWMVIAFVGVPLASGLFGVPSFSGENWLLGAFLAFIAAAAYVAVTQIVRGIKGQRPEVTMMVQALVGAVLLCFLADFNQTISLPSWGWLMGMGIIHTGLVMVAMYATFPLLPTPVIAIMEFIYPVVAILLDLLVYGHPLTLLQGLGMVLIVIATLGVNLKWSILSRLPGRV